MVDMLYASRRPKGVPVNRSFFKMVSFTAAAAFAVLFLFPGHAMAEVAHAAGDFCHAGLSTNDWVALSVFFGVGPAVTFVLWVLWLFMYGHNHYRPGWSVEHVAIFVVAAAAHIAMAGAGWWEVMTESKETYTAWFGHCGYHLQIMVMAVIAAVFANGIPFKLFDPSKVIDEEEDE